jgi:hypothetical protein
VEEARVVIDLKEGIIELQGPVNFVKHYLEVYRPAIKRLPREAAASQEELKHSSRTRSAKGKRISCTAAIRKEVKAGFFDQSKTTGDIKWRLNEAGFEFNEGNIRNSLKRLTNLGILSANGKGRGLTYSKPSL